MRALRALVYVSSAMQRLSESDLEYLLRGARRFNASASLSGVLLYHDGSFFQYLEGDPRGVRQAYARIRASPLHEGIIELLHGTVPRRHFDDWHMGFSRANASMLLALSQARWQQVPIGSPADDNAGVHLLRDFWQRCGDAGG
jgi:hypothetical protein